jgi:hypothetical protein
MPTVSIDAVVVRHGAATNCWLKTFRDAPCTPTTDMAAIYATPATGSQATVPRATNARTATMLASRVAVQIVETVTRYAIEWTASYRFEGDGDAFVVTDESGQRLILGYPVRELAQAEQRTAR